MVDVNKSFPEIQDRANKESVKFAGEKVLKEKKIYNPTPWDCWAYWLSISSGCTGICQLEGGDFITCMNWCLALALFEYGLCMGIAEV